MAAKKKSQKILSSIVHGNAVGENKSATTVSDDAYVTEPSSTQEGTALMERKSGGPCSPQHIESHQSLTGEPSSESFSEQDNADSISNTQPPGSRLSVEETQNMEDQKVLVDPEALAGISRQLSLLELSHAQATPSTSTIVKAHPETDPGGQLTTKGRHPSFSGGKDTCNRPIKQENDDELLVVGGIDSLRVNPPDEKRNDRSGSDDQHEDWDPDQSTDLWHDDDLALSDTDAEPVYDPAHTATQTRSIQHQSQNRGPDSVTHCNHQHSNLYAEASAITQILPVSFIQCYSDDESYGIFAQALILAQHDLIERHFNNNTPTNPSNPSLNMTVPQHLYGLLMGIQHQMQNDTSVDQDRDKNTKTSNDATSQGEDIQRVGVEPVSEIGIEMDTASRGRTDTEQAPVLTVEEAEEEASRIRLERFRILRSMETALLKTLRDDCGIPI